jgi:hypothetical protein
MSSLAKGASQIALTDEQIDDAESCFTSAVSWWFSLACAAAMIIPNYFIYSSDDLAVSTQRNPIALLAVDQASNGRYTAWLVLKTLKTLRVGYEAHLAMSGAALAVCSAWLLCETFALAKIDSLRARLVGTAMYFTFCFNLDIFQFKEVYLSFALSFGLAALALRIGRVFLPVWARIAGSALCLMLSIGGYQASAQIYLLAVSLWALSQLAHDPPYTPHHRAWTLVPAGAAAAVLYFICNKVLAHYDIEGFLAFATRRPFGLQFVSANYKDYFATIFDVASPRSHIYFPLTNPLTSIGYALILVIFLIYFTLAAGQLWKKVLIWTILVAALLCAPNPANLAMQVYWPSPRSVAGIAVFYSGVAALLVDSMVARAGNGGVVFRSLGWLLLLIISVQTANDAYILGRRSVQQQADFVLAQQIIAEIERLWPEIEVPITANVVQHWSVNSIYKNVPYGFGSGLFDTDWSAPALLTLVSGGAVVGMAGERSQCDSVKSSVSPVITPISEGVVRVCLPMRRIGQGVGD